MLYVLDKNAINTEILWNIIQILNKCFLFEYFIKYNLFM